MTYLKLPSLSIAFGICLDAKGDDLDELHRRLAKHQWNLKLWVLIQKVYINSDMLLYIKFRMLSTT